MSANEWKSAKSTERPISKHAIFDFFDFSLRIYSFVRWDPRTVSTVNTWSCVEVTIDWFDISMTSKRKMFLRGQRLERTRDVSSFFFFHPFRRDRVQSEEEIDNPGINTREGESLATRFPFALAVRFTYARITNRHNPKMFLNFFSMIDIRTFMFEIWFARHSRR